AEVLPVLPPRDRRRHERHDEERSVDQRQQDVVRAGAARVEERFLQPSGGQRAAEDRVFPGRDGVLACERDIRVIRERADEIESDPDGGIGAERGKCWKDGREEPYYRRDDGRAPPDRAVLLVRN